MRAIKWGLGVGVLGMAAAWAQPAARVAPALEADPVELQALAHELLPLAGLWIGDGLALNEAGGALLDALVAQWRREFVRIDRVRVVGHVQDPQSSAEQAAARQRVQLVQQTLVARGGRQWRYLGQVLPLSASTLSGCGGMAEATLLQQCPLATRAVAIEVLGVRR